MGAASRSSSAGVCARVCVHVCACLCTCHVRTRVHVCVCVRVCSVGNTCACLCKCRACTVPEACLCFPVEGCADEAAKKRLCAHVDTERVRQGIQRCTRACTTWAQASVVHKGMLAQNSPSSAASRAWSECHPLFLNTLSLFDCDALCGCALCLRRGQCLPDPSGIIYAT